jgi:hypothetical protein
MKLTIKKEIRPHNSTFAISGVSSSKYSNVVNGIFVLLINICGENRQLILAPKRYASHKRTQ